MKTKLFILTAFLTFALNSHAQLVTPDPSFGIEGLSSHAPGFKDAEVTSSVLQPDGKIVIAGYVDDGVNFDFALVRLNTDGTLDATF